MISDVRDAVVSDTLRSRFLNGPGGDWVSAVNGVPVKEYSLLRDINQRLIKSRALIEAVTYLDSSRIRPDDGERGLIVESNKAMIMLSR